MSSCSQLWYGSCVGGRYNCMCDPLVTRGSYLSALSCVYTMQLVVQSVVQPVVQRVSSCIWGIRDAS